MYAVVFKSVLNENQDGSYGKMADYMDELVKNQEGFIGLESYRNDNGIGRTISYWESMAAIEKWRNNKQHIQAKNLGKQEWYKSYTLDFIHIRQYQEGDAKALAAIYYNTIHYVNIRDYSAEQVNAWAPESSLETEGWIKKWAKLPPFVAILDNEIVGFAELEGNGHIDCFYIHHEYQSRGIGSSLMKAIEKQVLIQNSPRIFAEVSITARPFFERNNFCVTKEQKVTIRGIELTNFVMEKYL